MRKFFEKNNFNKYVMSINVLTFIFLVVIINSQTNENIKMNHTDESYNLINVNHDNITSKDQDISFTINNVLVTDNYLEVTSTITCNEPLQKVLEERSIVYISAHKDNKERSTQLKDNLHLMNPQFSFKVNGEDTDFDLISYSEDVKTAYSFTSYQKFSISDPVPDAFKLTINSKVVCSTIGDWNFNLNINKSSDLDSIKVFPKMDAKVSSIIYGKKINHNITIDEIAISSHEGQIKIGEQGKNIFSDFTLKDNDGNYYSILNSTIKYNNDGTTISNLFRFMCFNNIKELNELTLIPIMTDRITKVKEIMGQDNKLPTKIEISNIGGYIIEDLEIDKKGLAIKLKPYGVVLGRLGLTNGGFGLLDKNGSDEINKYISFSNAKYDYDNGLIIINGSWTDDAPGDVLNQISGVWHITIPNMTLLEEEALTIPLNKAD